MDNKNDEDGDDLFGLFAASTGTPSSLSSGTPAAQRTASSLGLTSMSFWDAEAEADEDRKPTSQQLAALNGTGYDVASSTGFFGRAKREDAGLDTVMDFDELVASAGFDGSYREPTQDPALPSQATRSGNPYIKYDGSESLTNSTFTSPAASLTGGLDIPSPLNDMLGASPNTLSTMFGNASLAVKSTNLAGALDNEAVNPSRSIYNIGGDVVNEDLPNVYGQGHAQYDQFGQPLHSIQQQMAMQYGMQESDWSSRSSSLSGPSQQNSSQSVTIALPAISGPHGQGGRAAPMGVAPSALAAASTGGYTYYGNPTSPSSSGASGHSNPTTPAMSSNANPAYSSRRSDDLSSTKGPASSDSAGTSRTHTAKNTPPGSVKHSRSTSSLEGLGRMQPMSTMTPLEHSKSTTSLTGLQYAASAEQTQPTQPVPDKAAQQQACESSSIVRAIYREPAHTPAAIAGLLDGCQLLILGLPDEGARSRVETQVKIGLALLHPRYVPAASSAMPRPRAINFKDDKGAITAEADQHFERVGSWKYLSLPAVSSVKRHAKKHARNDVPLEQTLFADIKVVSASHPNRQIFICSNCQQREFKRLQRKTHNRNKPVQEVEEASREDESHMSNDELAKRKIVLFNCGQYLDFSGGEAVIPTRITCYCRHHKEKYGFTIVVSLHDHKNNPVASAMSPPIFLTDDHKAKPTKPDGIGPHHISAALAKVANGPHSEQSSRTNSAWTSGASSAFNSLPGSEVSSAASSRRPSRSNSVEALTLEDGNDATQADTMSVQQSQSANRSAVRKDRSTKPYSLETRPHKGKRVASMNRLNSFTMTPLNRSAPGSPKLGQLAIQSPSTLVATLTEYLATVPANNTAVTDVALAQTLTTQQGDYASPQSSQSAPSTPAASLDGFATSWAAYANQADNTTSLDEALSGYRSVDQSPAYHTGATLPSMSAPQLSPNPQSSSVAAMDAQQYASSLQPLISRTIPAEGPMHGGVEVVILGQNFSPGLEVCFGDAPPIATQAWGPNTLACILPPSATPGPVIVHFKDRPYQPTDPTKGLPIFTYTQTTDKALMELALQVVGMNMTGRIVKPEDVARSIVSSSAQSGLTSMPSGISPQSLSAAFHHGSSFEGRIMAILDARFELSSASAFNHANASGHTLLHLASVLGLHRLVAFLLRRNIDVNAQDIIGHTALHLAVISGRYSVARLLLYGSTHSVCNSSEYTAGDLAVHYDQAEIAELIAQYEQTWLHQQHAIRLQARRRARKLFSLGFNDSVEGLRSSSPHKDLPVSADDSCVIGLASSGSAREGSCNGEWLDGRHVDDTDTDSDSDQGSEALRPTSSSTGSTARSATGSTLATSLSDYCLGATLFKYSKGLAHDSAFEEDRSSTVTGSRSVDFITSTVSPAVASDDVCRTQRRANIDLAVTEWLDCFKAESSKLISQCLTQHQATKRDRMLLFFWLPLLMLASLWAVLRFSTGFNTVAQWLDGSSWTNFVGHSKLLHLL